MVEEKLEIKKKKSKFTIFLTSIFGKTAGSIVFHILNYLFFIILLLIFFYPFFYVLKTSLIVNDISSGTPVKKLSFESYILIFKNEGLLRAFLVSIGVVAVFVVIHVFLTILSAYPLTRKNLKGRKFFLLFLVFTMLFSGGLIPYYILIKDLHLRDNILVYLIPGMISAFDIIIARNFINTIPEEIIESARIDGAAEFTILFKIVMPLTGPIIATIALWAGVGKWNDWMTGVLYMQNSKNLWMIQQFLRNILITSTSGTGVVDPDIMMMAEGVKMAAIVVSVIPIMIIYPFVQKYFVKGVLLGSVKG